MTAGLGGRLSRVRSGLFGKESRRDYGETVMGKGLVLSLIRTGGRVQGRRSGTTDHANDGGVGWPWAHPYALESLVFLLALAIIFLDWNRWYLVVAGFILIGLGLWLAVTASNLFCDSRGTRSNKGRWAILVLGWGSLIALSVSGLLLIPWREP